DPERHGGGRGRHQPRERGVGADVADPLDDSSTAYCREREAREVAAQHDTGEGRAEVLDRDAQRDERSEQPVGELDEARRENQGADRGAHGRQWPGNIFSIMYGKNGFDVARSSPSRLMTSTFRSPRGASVPRLIPKLSPGSGCNP